MINNKVELYHKDILLRDMKLEDINDYITWYTTETEWQNWDAPWESEEGVNNSIEVVKDTYMTKLNKPLSSLRRRFEICYKNNHHIGWVSSYYIDGNQDMLAIGIDITNPEYRGKKLGECAFSRFISYLLHCDIPDIYTQTWSGNTRMIKLALKCGFKEVNRVENFRTVKGKYYDDLTFKLNKELFWGKYSNLKQK